MKNIPTKESERTSAKKELLAEKVYQGIRKMIADYRWKPGVRLNVMKMARELGVSRTPVWEAVRRLEQEGILHSVPNRGVFMAETSLERSLEVVQVRGALDVLAVRLAGDRMNDSLLSQLAQCLSDQLQAIENEDLVLYSSADFGFHRLIYDASGNRYLLELFESITLQMRPTRLKILPILPSLYLVHQEILEAFSKGSSSSAEKAMIRHNDIVLELTKEQIKNKSDRDEFVRQARRRPHITPGPTAAPRVQSRSKASAAKD
jgi:DNA-binding GntR family transcriptional regulator